MKNSAEAETMREFAKRCGERSTWHQNASQVERGMSDDMMSSVIHRLKAEIFGMIAKEADDTADAISE